MTIKIVMYTGKRNVTCLRVNGPLLAALFLIHSIDSRRPTGRSCRTDVLQGRTSQKHVGTVSLNMINLYVVCLINDDCHPHVRSLREGNVFMVSVCSQEVPILKGLMGPHPGPATSTLLHGNLANLFKRDHWRNTTPSLPPPPPTELLASGRIVFDRNSCLFLCSQ